MLMVLDLATGAWSSLKLSREILMNDGWNLRYMAGRDRLFMYSPRGGQTYAGYPTLVVINPDTGQVSTPGFTGTQPSAIGGGDWAETLDAYFYYEGRPPGAGNTVFRLTPSQNFETDPWVWASHTLTGTAIATAGSINHNGRFRWVPRCDCFLWWPDPTQDIQAFRLP